MKESELFYLMYEQLISAKGFDELCIFVKYIVFPDVYKLYITGYHYVYSFNHNFHTILGVNIEEIDWKKFHNYVETQIRNATTLV